MRGQEILAFFLSIFESTTIFVKGAVLKTSDSKFQPKLINRIS